MPEVKRLLEMEHRRNGLHAEGRDTVCVAATGKSNLNSRVYYTALYIVKGVLF
jgi:hypothetical protein